MAPTLLRPLALRWASSRALRHGTVIALDALVTVCALCAALLFSLNVRITREYTGAMALAVSLLVGARLALGWFARRRRTRRAGALRTIVVGAGAAADLLARDLLHSWADRYCVVGFVDDDPAKIGTGLQGKPVLGSLKELPELMEKHQVRMVLLAVPRLPAERIREILSMCGNSKASFKIIPTSFAYLDERLSAAMLHDLTPEDLLPRDSVAFDRAEIRGHVEGRRVMVTGAGGSIGGELCHQLAANGVWRLVMVDLNENELYVRARKLEEDHPGVYVHCEVANIRDASRLQRLALEYQPQYVFHAAAHKHVPLMESAPEEAVKNNVFGTLNVARMAHECGAERLVVVSTDAAVKPTSVMGATMRIAELVTRLVAHGSRTQMTAVRFGNVLGSAGSVVPIFQRQIERGGPVTVTHPDCTRFFMTVPEAVGLVLVAGLGGYGELCVLDMGEPIRIADLAANLITMAGHLPEVEIPIVFVGLRPGEKLYEDLLTEDGERTKQVRDRIKVAKGPPPPRDLEDRLRELKATADAGDREAVLREIEWLVPSYRRTPNRPTEIAPPEPTPRRALAQVLPLCAVLSDER
jgi:FlaA1/EpsC-like NDP-sugar epimerase